jgi:broad specificity phosphatase PhoE
MEKTTLWITRHGQTMFNVLRRVQGWCDSPLTIEGIAVAKQLGKGLSGVHFGAVYSSDSGRARETAHLVLAEQSNQSLVLQEDMRLREYCFGPYEGGLDSFMREQMTAYESSHPQEKPANALTAYFANTLVATAKMHQGANPQLQEAESYAVFSQRVMVCIHEIASQALQNQHSDVLIVCHGVVITSIWQEVKQLEGYKPGIANCSIMKLEYQDGVFSLMCANDVSYLQ